MIIGITGTLGAGKGTVVQYLVDRHGYVHYSVRSFLTSEVLRLGLSLSRDTLVATANEFRLTYGPDYIARELFARAMRDSRHAVIESIRSLGEADYLISHGARLWAVDADIRVRYRRISARASETDGISFEKFVSDEQRELNNQDAAKGNIAGVIARADHVFHNNGTLEDLHRQIEDALQKS